jgi:hypothetical protein
VTAKLKHGPAASLSTSPAIAVNCAAAALPC